MKCPNCKNEYKAGEKFCEKCGAKLPEETARKQICPNCGKTLDSDASFCTKCGAKIEPPQNNKPKSAGKIIGITAGIIAAVAAVFIGVNLTAPKETKKPERVTKISAETGDGQDNHVLAEPTAQPEQSSLPDPEDYITPESQISAAPGDAELAESQSLLPNAAAEIPLHRVAQAAFLSPPIEDGNFTQDIFDELIYHICKFAEAYQNPYNDYYEGKPFFDEDYPDLNIDVFNDMPAEMRTVFETAEFYKDGEYGSRYAVLDAQAVKDLCYALYGEAANEQVVNNMLPNIWGYSSAEYEDGRIKYGLNFEGGFGGIYYADIDPYPHSENNTYAFMRLEYESADDNGTLYSTTITPNSSSSFGFNITDNLPYWKYFREDGTTDADYDYSYRQNGFVFPESNTRYLTQEDFRAIADKYNDTYRFAEDYLPILGYARNEIFARHGNIFDTPKYTEFYSNFDWYTPARKIEYNELSDIEKANVDTIKEWEEWCQNNPGY